MLTKLEQEYDSETIANLIIINHGEFSGEFEIGGKADRLDIMSSSQIQRLKKLLSPNACIDIRMCYGIKDQHGEDIVQRLANELECQIRAYSNQVSPLGTPPFPKDVENIPWPQKYLNPTGEKDFFPKK